MGGESVTILGWENNCRPGGKWRQPTAGWMAQSFMRADCLHTGISSGLKARNRVWENCFTCAQGSVLLLRHCDMLSTSDFLHDITLAHRMGQNQAWRYISLKFARWQHQLDSRQLVISATKKTIRDVHAWGRRWPPHNRRQWFLYILQKFGEIRISDPGV